MLVLGLINCLCKETNTFTMSLSLLLLLVCSTQATHFYGTVMTYYPKNTNTAELITVRTALFKSNFIHFIQQYFRDVGDRVESAVNSVS